MKTKQKTSWIKLTTRLLVLFVCVAAVSISQPNTTLAEQWDKDYDCSQETGDYSTMQTNQEYCEMVKEQCAAGFSGEAGDVSRETCESEGYTYDSSGNLTTDSTDSGEKCEDLKTSILNVDSLCKDKDGPIFGLLKWVLRIMTAGVGVAAVGGIAWGALLYTTAENKPEQTKKAISIITNVVIGIVAYALMAVFLNFLIPGGIIG